MKHDKKQVYTDLEKKAISGHIAHNHLSEISKLVKYISNDKDLGEAIRKYVKLYGI